MPRWRYSVAPWQGLFCSTTFRNRDARDGELLPKKNEKVNQRGPLVDSTLDNKMFGD